MNALDNSLRIYKYFKEVNDTLSAAELDMTVRHDMAEWAEHLSQAPGISGISPTHNPEHSVLDGSNAYWICVRNRRGTIVATMANRIFQTEDFRQLILTNRAWYDKSPRPIHPINLVLPADTPVLSGNVGCGGGLWVHPDYRGCHVGVNLARLSKLIALQHYEVDWQLSFIKEANALRGNQTDGYLRGNTIVPCIDGYYPPLEREMSIWLAFMDRARLLELAGKDVRPVVLVPDADDQPVHRLAVGRDR